MRRSPWLALLLLGAGCAQLPVTAGRYELPVSAPGLRSRGLQVEWTGERPCAERFFVFFGDGVSEGALDVERRTLTWVGARRHEVRLRVTHDDVGDGGAAHGLELEPILGRTAERDLVASGSTARVAERVQGDTATVIYPFREPGVVAFARAPARDGASRARPAAARVRAAAPRGRPARPRRRDDPRGVARGPGPVGVRDRAAVPRRDQRPGGVTLLVGGRGRWPRPHARLTISRGRSPGRCA